MYLILIGPLNSEVMEENKLCYFNAFAADEPLAERLTRPQQTSLFSKSQKWTIIFFASLEIAADVVWESIRHLLRRLSLSACNGSSSSDENDADDDDDDDNGISHQLKPPFVDKQHSLVEDWIGQTLSKAQTVENRYLKNNLYLIKQP